MRKVLKIITVLTICMAIFSAVTFAMDFDPEIYNPGNPTDIGKIGTIGNKIIGVFQVVGTIIAIATLIWMGIKLVLASPGERANVKAHTVPYIVGAVMLFSIVNLLAIVSNLMTAAVGG